ncbi:MAG TPA: PqqD family protein [Bryobacteraceae bacterium]|jgi:hypothetical protein|nr:PqqD family protein [Bryobacteraceae bacterium]
MGEVLPSAVMIGDSVLYQELEDEVVLLNMANQQYYGLNDVGAQMWKTLMEIPSVTAALDRLTELYEVDPDVLDADLHRLVRELLEAGLLKTA